MLQNLGEVLAAYELLLRCPEGDWQLFHDGTSIQQWSTICVAVKAQDKQTGEEITRSLRGAYFVEGKTAQLELEGVEQAFTNAQELLTLWRQVHESMFPEHEHNIPAAEGFTLANMGSVMSDTANQAQSLSKKIAHVAMRLRREKLERSGEWEKLSKDERERRLRVDVEKCVHHLRQLVVEKGAKAEVVIMKSLLEEWLKQASGRERLEADVDALLRSVSKEFGTNPDAYKKGKGISYFLGWLTEHHPDSVFLR